MTVGGGHATLHCWDLKRHLEDLVQCEYLEEFVLDQEEDPEVGDTVTPRFPKYAGAEARHESATHIRKENTSRICAKP